MSAALADLTNAPREEALESWEAHEQRCATMLRLLPDDIAATDKAKIRELLASAKKMRSPARALLFYGDLME